MNLSLRGSFQDTATSHDEEGGRRQRNYLRLSLAIYARTESGQQLGQLSKGYSPTNINARIVASLLCKRQAIIDFISTTFYKCPAIFDKCHVDPPKKNTKVFRTMARPKVQSGFPAMPNPCQRIRKFA